MRRWAVRDVMTIGVVTVGESTPYKDIVETLATHAVGAVPVADHDGRVVGIVSEADLLYKLEFFGPEPDLPAAERERLRGAWTKASASTAKDLMSAPPIVIDPAASVTAAARLMDAEGVKRLPVLDAAGRLVGILSRRDLLRAYLRDDWEIREEIVTTVLVSTVWVDPSTITVAVHRGVVTLGGTVESRSIAPLLVSVVGCVAGVVDIVNQLTRVGADGALEPA